MPVISERLKLPLILLLVAVLLLLNLGEFSLGQDEAATAILARRVLSFGRPLAFDGRNHLLPECLNHWRENYVWTFDAWGQYYFTALSFVTLGVSTFSARLPFAVFGLLSLWLLHSFCCRHLKDKAVADLATLLLALSVPFLVHVTQCRYYALSIFFTIAVLDSYLMLIKQQKRVLPYFIFSAVFLFQANYGTSAPVMFAVFFHFLCFRLYRRSWRSFGLALSAVFMLTFPWLIYLKAWQRPATFNAFEYAGHLIRYVLHINDWIFPVVIALPCFIMLFRERADQQLAGFKKSEIYLFLLVIIFNLLIVSAYTQIYFRYMIHLAPLFVIFISILFTRIIKSKVVKYTLIAFLLTSNLLGAIPYCIFFFMPLKFVNFNAAKIAQFVSPGPVASGAGLQPAEEAPAYLDRFVKKKALGIRPHLFLYLRQISSGRDDAIKRLAGYLNQHASPDDLLYTNAEHLPVMFYTDLIIQRPLGDESASGFLPQWVIIDLTDESGVSQRISRETINQGGYEPVGRFFQEEDWFDKPDYDYPKFSMQKRKTKLLLFHLGQKE